MSQNVPTNMLRHSRREGVLMRLDTLIRLRWYAIIGQAGAVIVIAFFFGYPMPWAICLALVASSSVLNILLNRAYRAQHHIASSHAFLLLAFDLTQLGLLLFMTGGLQNPFVVLLLAPVIVSAASLRRKHIVMLGFLSFGLISLLAYLHLPLPWNPDEPLKMPFLYIVGVWVALTCTLAFTAIYVFRVAQEAHKLADALAATELVLQRETHLTAIDGLAAAAAHELGTPLATIALVAKEMTHTFEKDHPLYSDAQLLNEQAKRCRDILQKLASLSSEGVSMLENQPLTLLIDAVVEPIQAAGRDVEIVVTHRDDKVNEPTITRSPGVQYALSNLVDNAADFASGRVEICMEWSDDFYRVTVMDDGRGIPPNILERLGEPFLSKRPSGRGKERGGMGLGLFIAKTLLERDGATVAFSNGGLGAAGNVMKGACVKIEWPYSQ